MQLAMSAERLVAILWNTAISGMLKGAISDDSLGTGSGPLNDLATESVSGALFGKTDSSLVSQIVSELDAHRAAMPSDRASPPRAPLPSTMANVLGMSVPSDVQGTSGALGATIAGAVSFAKSIWPYIAKSARSLQVSPIALLAQSALETGWGSSTPDNNIFGIKEHDNLPATKDATTEEQSGSVISTIANFSAYPSVAQSTTDYTNLVMTHFRSAIGSSSISRFAAALQNNGYATDSSYANKIVEIAHSPFMEDVLRALGIEETVP
ncbi:MAG TPA: glucosaminidase domain-containing protein [Acetobacteraceae bacterium]|nr:glucosaminidase domain-containing protein [Acetobacteraceae bacterium]